MGWFRKQRAPKPNLLHETKLEIPDDVWTKCPDCSQILYTREVRRLLGVCSKCGYHFRLSARERLATLVDPGTFIEMNEQVRASDPLSFKDSKRYRDRLKKAERDSKSTEAVITGKAMIKGISVCLAIFDFKFMGGSMGSAVGERLVRIIETAIMENLPQIIVSASGGARMQEGIFSLMQMAKVSVALYRLGERNLPYISVLTDPTTGGVAASFAMQGDIILAEPKALIGFAGPRVIEQTIKQKLPKGFQRSEFLLEHGMIDRIVRRADLREDIAGILGNLGFNPHTSAKEY